MTSKANAKNMSSMDSSYEQYSGSDSESSFSEDFNDIGIRGTSKKVEMNEVSSIKRLQADDLSDGKYECFILKGDLFNDDDEVGCFWEDAEEFKSNIRWGICDLDGNEGICADGIAEGLAFWNKEQKCYHSLENLTDNEYVYRIISIETKPKKKSKKKAEKKAETKPKKKAEKKAEKKPKKKAESSGEGCKWVFVKGKSAGKSCGKSCEDDSDFCSKHTKCGEKVKEKNEKNNQSDSDSAGMTSQANAKNMSAVLSALAPILSEIITGTLKEKYAAKAIEALQTQDAQDKITAVLTKHMPTKTVRKKTSSKKTKDPAAPKKNRSAYIFFCMTTRSSVKTENPDFKTTEITAELGRRWKNMSDDEKQPFTKQSAEDKKRYEAEMKDYTPSPEWQASQDSDSGDDKKKTKKKKTGPKRALSAYMFFCMEKRPEVKDNNTDMTTKEITAELGRMWREEYKDTKKGKKYTKMAEKDRERYNTEKENWVDEDSKSEAEDSEGDKQQKNSKTDSASESEDDKPKKADTESASDSEADSEDDKPKKKTKKKTKTPFVNFCLKHRAELKKENPKWKAKQITNELTKQWDSMDQEEQQAYESEE